jgi:hypothetical protein
LEGSVSDQMEPRLAHRLTETSWPTQKPHAQDSDRMSLAPRKPPLPRPITARREAWKPFQEATRVQPKRLAFAPLAQLRFLNQRLRRVSPPRRRQYSLDKATFATWMSSA